MIIQFDTGNMEHREAFRKLLTQQVHHHNNCGRGLFEDPWSEEDIAQSERNFLEGIQEGTHHVLLYEADNSTPSDICGMCAYRVFDTWIDGIKVAFIDELVIDERKRGHGLGRLFIEEIEAFLIENDFDGIQLSCYIANDSAIEFYKAIGMTCVGMEFEKKFDKKCTD